MTNKQKTLLLPSPPLPSFFTCSFLYYYPIIILYSKMKFPSSLSYLLGARSFVAVL